MTNCIYMLDLAAHVTALCKFGGGVMWQCLHDTMHWKMRSSCTPLVNNYLCRHSRLVLL